MIFLYIVLAALFVYVIYEFLFWVTHKRPLYEDEVISLGCVSKV
jgi:hypothetical protein